MVQKVKNIAASVRTRLLNISRASGRDFDALMLQYMQGRFLYLLSVSPYHRHMVQKGALFFLAYEMTLLRPTKDIDFLGSSISNDLEEVRKMISGIIGFDNDDGVMFNQESLHIERITEGAEYQGVRVKFEAQLTSDWNWK